MVIVTLEYALGSIGGLCLGSTEVVDHQRLSGAGYCFSASAPPFVSTAALKALEVRRLLPRICPALGRCHRPGSFFSGRARGPVDSTPSQRPEANGSKV